jgi:DNA-binding transcriptional LysR family regulator
LRVSKQANLIEATLQYCLTIDMGAFPHLLDTRLLSTFMAIADTGSFAVAANRVGRTQSAVSMQMKRLEEIAGPPALFMRTGRRMVMTPRGEALLVHVRRVLHAHAEMIAMLADVGLIATVRLGSPEDYIASLLPAALDRFARLYPNVEVEVACEPSETLHRYVAERKIDLAVVTRNTSTPDAETLRLEPLVWVTSPFHRPYENAVMPLAVFQFGCMSRGMALDACAAEARPYRIAYSSPSLSGLLAVVRQGLAVAALAKCSVPDGVRVLTEADGMPPLPSLAISLLQSETAPTEPAVAALAQEIRSTLTVCEAARSCAPENQPQIPRPCLC